MCRLDGRCRQAGCCRDSGCGLWGLDNGCGSWSLDDGCGPRCLGEGWHFPCRHPKVSLCVLRERHNCFGRFSMAIGLIAFRKSVLLHSLVCHLGDDCRKVGFDQAGYSFSTFTRGRTERIAIDRGHDREGRSKFLRQ